MKFLILAESLRINETSSGIVSSTFVQSLANFGHDITCLYPKTFEYPVSWFQYVKLVEFSYKPYKKKFIDKIPKIRALPSFLYGYSLEVRNKISQWIQIVTEIISKEKFDAIIVLSSGSEFLPHLAMLNVQTNIPIIFNFHDPFPWHVYPEPYRKSINISSYILHKKVQKIIDKATLVSFPSELLKQHMSKNYLGIEIKSIILPHAGTKLKNLPARNEDQNIFLDKTKFNILHAGSLLGPRNPKTFLKAFVKFTMAHQDHANTSVLTIVGKLAKEHTDIVQYVQDNIRIYDLRISYKKSIELLKEASVLLLIEADADFSPFMPGKLADYIMSEKPILALTPYRSEVMRLLGENYPYWSTLNDEEQIYFHLKSLWQCWKSGTLHSYISDNLKYYISDENINKTLIQKFHTCVSTSSSPMV